jgi:hypothetical protein
MKRWLGLFAVLAVAAFMAIAFSSRRHEHYGERVHRVQTGMEFEDMMEVMEGFRCKPEGVQRGIDGLLQGETGYVEWGIQWPDHDPVPIRIYVDADNRVTRKTMGGERLP